MPRFEIESTINYEKRIALYNAYGTKCWSYQKKDSWLKDCIKEYPHKAFAWLKLLENVILNNEFDKFKKIEKQIEKINLIDYRINVYLAMGYLKFKENSIALKIILEVVEKVEMDPIPKRIATRILLDIGDMKEASRVFSKINSQVTPENVFQIFNKEPLDKLPIYYDY